MLVLNPTFGVGGSNVGVLLKWVFTVVCRFGANMLVFFLFPLLIMVCEYVLVLSNEIFSID